MATSEQVTLIKEFLITKFSPYVIYLFGSQASNQTHSESDFDIAFISEQEVDTYERFMISQELAAALNKDVDLIDLDKASTVFQTQIINAGVLLHCSDESKRTLFEMYTLKKYAKLNEEREEILQNMIRRATSHEGLRNDVILNKIATIERCMKRIHEEYENNPAHLENYTKQDSIILNIQRACEASIDIAMHIVSIKKFGIPQTSRDAFEFLANNHIISSDLSFKLKAMIGFRNIVVHDYQSVNLAVVQKIIENHLTDYTEFIKQVLSYEA